MRGSGPSQLELWEHHHLGFKCSSVVRVLSVWFVYYPTIDKWYYNEEWKQDSWGHDLEGILGCGPFFPLSLLLPARRRAASLPLPPYRPWDPSPRTKRFWTESPGTINQNKPLFSLTGSMQFVSALDSWPTQRRGAQTSSSDWGKRIWWRKAAVCMA